MAGYDLRKRKKKTNRNTDYTDEDRVRVMGPGIPKAAARDYERMWSAMLKGSVVETHRTILDLVHFWLMSVYTHAVPYSQVDSTYEPKVLIIGTFAGDKSIRFSKEKVESKVQELKVLIGSQPYQKQVLFPICVIDNKSSKGSEVNEIQDRIDGLIKDLEYMKVRKPVKWRTFLTEIEGSAQNTLTVSKKGDRGKHWTDLKEKGILSIELIQDVWKEHKGDDDQLHNIINMMIKFDLICEIPEGSNGALCGVVCTVNEVVYCMNQAWFTWCTDF
eukprot:XP_011661636.1 PREDICTED: uncharacterized protein LOC105437101 [Strongylocentrotus purpuratus]